MSINKRTLGISVYIKILCGLVIITMCFYSTSIIVNYIGIEGVKTGIIESFYTSLNYFKEGYENEVNRILEVQKEYLVDSNLHKLSMALETLSNYEKSKCILDTLDKLMVLKSSSPYIERACIYIPLLEMDIASDKGVMYATEGGLKELHRFSSLEGSPIVNHNGNYYLNVPYYSGIESNKSLLFCIYILLSNRSIEDNMKRIMGNSPGGVVLKYNDDDSIQFYSNIKGFNLLIPDIIESYINGKDTVIEYKNGSDSFILIGTHSDYLDLTFIYCIPRETFFKPLSKQNTLIMWISIFTFSLLAIYSYWLYCKFQKPLKRLVDAFKVAEQGNLEVNIKHSSNDEFGYVYKQFNNMIQKLNHLVHDVYEQKLRIKNAELKQLQYQINPHFLYNSFFIIYRMAKVQAHENISEFAMVLANYYRFINKNTSNDVTLSSEIQHCKNYIRIQEFRFRKRITVNMDYDEKTAESFYVPPLIIQPIVENAYEHGLSTVCEGGIINLSVSNDNEYLKITVEDNGNNLTDEKLNSLIEKLESTDSNIDSSGIINVHRRLQLRYSSKSGVRASRSSMGGLKIEILIQGGVEDA